MKVHADQFLCPDCHSSLVRKGMRTRIIEDVPEIYPRVIQYSIDRMYCRSCRKTYEPEVPEALHSARLSLRTMLIAAYFKQAMRLNLESVPTTMKQLFSIHVSEREV